MNELVIKRMTVLDVPEGEKKDELTKVRVEFEYQEEYTQVFLYGEVVIDIDKDNLIKIENSRASKSNVLKELVIDCVYQKLRFGKTTEEVREEKEIATDDMPTSEEVWLDDEVNN